MATDPALELIEVKIERALVFREGAAVAVVLSHPTKRFLIFVGPGEGAALQRELAHESSERPLTHDLFDYVLRGFDISVHKVVVSAIVNNVFCASLVLVQQAAGGASTNEVRIDARASDAMVIAVKAGVPLHVTRRVLDTVEDATDHLKLLDTAVAAQAKNADPPFAESDDESDAAAAEDVGIPTGEDEDDDPESSEDDDVGLEFDGGEDEDPKSDPPPG